MRRRPGEIHGAFNMQRDGGNKLKLVIAEKPSVAWKEMKEMQTAKYNVDQFLRAEEQEHRDKQKKRERAR